MNADARELAACFDIEKLTPEFYQNPYPTYRALREHEPVKRLRNGSWFLTRYDDLVTAYKSTRQFSSDKKKEFFPKYGDSLLYEHHTTSLVFNDPPAHTRVRRLIMGALSPRAIAGMEPDLIALVNRLLDTLAAREKLQGKVDLIDDFAAAIPIEVIGNLLDVPQGERGPLRDWSLAILGALEPVIPAEVFARGNKAVQEFLAYLEILVARRRAKPGNPERDVLTRLIQGEDNGERLTEKELLHNCIFLLNAGHETTTNLIGNGLVALSGNPAQKKRLIEHPDLIKTAVEEILRFESSNQLGNRMTTEAVELGGVKLARRHAGDAVHRRRQPRPRAVRRSRNPRHRPHPEPPSRLRHRRPSMRRHGAGAPRRRDRDLAISGAVSGLRADRRAAARRPRAVSRIFERAVRGRAGPGAVGRRRSTHLGVSSAGAGWSNFSILTMSG